MTDMTPREAVEVLREVVDFEERHAEYEPRANHQAREALATLATLSALADRAGWQPIETAPRGLDPRTKCGPMMLLTDGETVEQGFYHDGSHCYGHRGEAGFFASEDWGPDRLLIASNIHPTHWMPLPAAPGASHD